MLLHLFSMSLPLAPTPPETPPPPPPQGILARPTCQAMNMASTKENFELAGLLMTLIMLTGIIDTDYDLII